MGRRDVDPDHSSKFGQSFQPSGQSVPGIGWVRLRLSVGLFLGAGTDCAREDEGWMDCRGGYSPVAWTSGASLIKIVHLCTNNNRIMRHHSCSPQESPTIPSSPSLTPDVLHILLPPSRAAQNCHEGVVKLLLGRKEVSPDSSSRLGRTPLSLAAEKGHEGIVKLLLGRKEVNPDTPDTKHGRTPLLWATRRAMYA